MVVAFVDIDGVVADARHRLHYILGRQKKGSPPDWDRFYANVHLDPPIPEGVALVRGLVAGGVDVRFLTGRRESTREATISWLRAHVGVPETTPLYMRRDRDGMPAPNLKTRVVQEVLATVGVTRAIGIDDDPKVVAAYQKLGLYVVHVLGYRVDDSGPFER